MVTNKVHVSVKQKAVLASVNIRHWTGRRLDREITDEVNQAHNASADAGRFNKLLMPKQALANVAYMVSTARVAFYTETLPWLNNARILPTERYDEFARRFRKFREEFNIEADKFTRDFPRNKALRAKELNGMFREEDYPAQSQVRGLFSFDVNIMPFPDSADFRVNLADKQIQDIKNDLEAKLQESIDLAMKEPIRRVIGVVGHMVERLKEYKPADKKKGTPTTGKFTDSLVDNIRELCEVLPAFNLTNNADLTRLTDRMVKELCRNDAQDLREDEDLRKKVKKSAQEILSHAEMLMA